MNRQPRNLTLYYLTFAMVLVALLFAANHYVFKKSTENQEKAPTKQLPLKSSPSKNIK